MQYKKEFDDLIIEENWIVSFLKNLKYDENNFFRLNEQFSKFKFFVLKNNVRWIIYIMWNWVVSPIFIVKKSDKQYWMNLVLTKELKKILELKLEKIERDINNDDFQLYEIDNNYKILKL